MSVYCRCLTFFFSTGLYATSNGHQALSKVKKLKSKDISQFIAVYLKQVIGPSDYLVWVTLMNHARKGILLLSLIPMNLYTL